MILWSKIVCGNRIKWAKVMLHFSIKRPHHLAYHCRNLLPGTEIVASMYWLGTMLFTV